MGHAKSYIIERDELSDFFFYMTELYNYREHKMMENEHHTLWQKSNLYTA